MSALFAPWDSWMGASFVSEPPARDRGLWLCCAVKWEDGIGFGVPPLFAKDLSISAAGSMVSAWLPQALPLGGCASSGALCM